MPSPSSRPSTNSARLANPRPPACTAYSRFILDVGQSEDWFALQIALLPCLLGYGMIASRLHGLQSTDASTKENRYRRWIENYVAEDYVETVRKGRGMCDSEDRYSDCLSPFMLEVNSC